jgi:hypothetical protein
MGHEKFQEHLDQIFRYTKTDGETIESLKPRLQRLLTASMELITRKNEELVFISHSTKKLVRFNVSTLKTNETDLPPEIRIPDFTWLTLPDETLFGCGR